MTATISLVAGSQPEALIGAGARMQTSIAALGAQIATQQQALGQLSDSWERAAADAALTHAHKNLQQQHDRRTFRQYVTSQG